MERPRKYLRNHKMMVAMCEDKLILKYIGQVHDLSPNRVLQAVRSMVKYLGIKIDGKYPWSRLEIESVYPEYIAAYIREGGD